MKFKCKNCNGYCHMPQKYKNGKSLNTKDFSQIEIKCDDCKSIHTVSMKFKQGNNHNIIAYIVDFQFIKKLPISNAFWFEETNNPFTLSGYITNCYLLLGFDSEKDLKEIIKSIKNEADRAILDSCFKIIKIARNKITQHNKNKTSLSSLNEGEIYPLFISSVNIMVNLLKKSNYLPYDINDRRIEARKIIFE